MQRCIADRGAADEHRFQFSDRGKLAGAANLNIYITHYGYLFFRRILVRHCPARLTRDKAKPRLKFEAVDFINHSIYVKRQTVPSGLNPLMKRHQSLRALLYAMFTIYRESPRRQLIQYFFMRLRQPALYFTQTVSIERQRTPRSQSRIQLADTSGRTVAWVNQGGQALLALPLVVAFKIVPAHVNLATYLEHRPGEAIKA